jgi:hypothetical protein
VFVFRKTNSINVITFYLNYDLDEKCIESKVYFCAYLRSRHAERENNMGQNKIENVTLPPPQKNSPPKSES